MADTKSSDDVNKVKTKGADASNRPDGENATNEVAKLTGSLLQNPEVMAAFEQKLAGMVGRKSGYIEGLPKSIKRRLKALKRLQFDYHNTESKFYEELHALECKYEELQKPILEKRRAIVAATKEPTDSECEWSSDEDEEEHGENEKAKIAEIDETNKNKEKAENEKETTVFSEDTKGIPEFWLTIFKNVESLSFMVQEHDEPILKNLLDIHVKLTSGGKMGFVLEFLFAPNDYFENSVLTKEYIMRCGPDPKDPLSYEGPQIIKCTGCKVDWKKGKNVTVKNVKQKQKGKGGQKKMVTKTVKCDSFFNFFSPPEVKGGDDDDDEEDDETQALLMQDFEVGQTLQQNIIPKAVLYFTGEALEGGDEDDDDYEYGEEGDDEDYNEDDDPEYKPKEGENQPSECKQQ